MIALPAVSRWQSSSLHTRVCPFATFSLRTRMPARQHAETRPSTSPALVRHLCPACCTRAEPATPHLYCATGIKILDVQVASFNCVDPRTQALLQTDVQTRVAKQNELRAAAVDVDVQTQRQTLVMK